MKRSEINRCFAAAWTPVFVRGHTGLDSGLAKSRSDYVARVNYSPNRTYTFSTRARFDEATMSVNRFEAEGRATFDRWSVSMMYGNYAAQPELGYLTRREGLLGTASGVQRIAYPEKADANNRLPMT